MEFGKYKMAKIIFVPSIDGLVENYGPTNKVTIFDRLVKQVDTQIKNQKNNFFIYSTDNVNCYETACALKGMINHHANFFLNCENINFNFKELNEINGKLKNLDNYMLRSLLKYEDLKLFVTTPEFANTYPNHFWKEILKCEGNIGKINEGQGLMFKFNDNYEFYKPLQSNCSCKILG
ncbi:MAG TPA: hypothetical protein P5277_01880 [Candidatus Paceibacterota bacterium]|nr:hypothetical protein [Candidatus Paceibacterota bacterium]